MIQGGDSMKFKDIEFPLLILKEKLKKYIYD